MSYVHEVPPKTDFKIIPTAALPAVVVVSPAAVLPGAAQSLQFRQYRRIEGVLDVPPQTVVKNVSAKVLEGTVTRAVQNLKI